MWTQVLYCHSNVVCKRITITLTNGYLMNRVEGHECPRWDLPLLITEDISLGLLMKYDCKIAWSCRTKSIWDIELIRYSVYFKIKKYKYWSMKGVTKSMPCDLYRYEDKWVIAHMNIIMKRFRQIIWHSCHLGSSDVLLDTVHCL